MRYITANIPPSDLHGVADISWHARATCNGVDPSTADELFFHTPNDDYAIAEAKEMCSWCPVRRECFNYALDNEVKEGVWGGLTEAERTTWHDQVENRLDYSRVKAVIEGRNVQLSRLERKTLTRYASARGWSPNRLAHTLQIGVEWARDLLRVEARAIENRDNHNLSSDPNPVETARQATLDGQQHPPSGKAHDGDGPERDRSIPRKDRRGKVIARKSRPVARHVQTQALINNLREVV
ncbi:WhiB family transcriptional regulator [Streptomyces sp. ZAF1911]|uniref:WhiB family transcriptional regulator n=1 Tax=Streptomyces sp. ZAF1911 TaxID=2944129 RepID=UPI00237C51BE|nr:WhiB family transcriptional regulator [Streptomyces sp. ZAF1911]MDD9380383.1 WhiB family transcriptional regulator [Streptomyces sp. ZAF1911]